jgi:hypothetical protein
VVGTNLYAGTYEFPGIVSSDSGGVFRSTNFGLNWTQVDNGIADTTIVWIPNPPHFDTMIKFPTVLCFAVYGENIFVGADSGVFLSTDSGSKWINTDLPTAGIMEALLINGSTLFVATDSSVWRRPLSDFGISSVSSQPVIQNNVSSYPNPFSARTQISITASESGYAEISIINALGAEVARLFSGELGAGDHSFFFDASDLAPGNYWCVMRINGRVETLPMTVLR